MTEEVKKLVKSLREDAEWAQANEWETPITLGDNLIVAADMIEAMEADRDAWKRKAEAAVKELNRIADCESCVNWKRSGLTDACLCCYKSGFVEVERNYTWRGPCAENGGERNADKG